jgi:thiosulfate dehydrogenase
MAEGYVNKGGLRKALVVTLLAIVGGIAACGTGGQATKNASQPDTAAEQALFTPPDTSTIPHDAMGDMIRYGRELVVNTAHYIGPNGTAGKYLGNKMNCGNCHLDAGTRPYGFNYFSTHARYPQYRGREDRLLNLGERINNCVERPHNGIPLPLDSKEIVAIECYIKWVGTNVPVGQHAKGDENVELAYPDRAADPQKGAVVFAQHCASCHGKEGQGVFNADSSTYVYPPLWGAYAYQKGSSPHRITKAAKFIKANMPYKLAYWHKPVLTDAEALDVAAFINDDRIHFRPSKHGGSPDYPNYKSKPLDYAVGPFLDTFSELQHKFGPYKPIIEYRKAHNLPANF